MGNNRSITRHSAEDIRAFEPMDRKPGRLSRQHFELLIRDADGRKYAQIAEEMNLPVGTVRSGLHRAQKAIAALIADRKAKAEQAVERAHA